MKISRRWLVPAGMAGAITLASALPHALANGGDPSLPAVVPVDLIAAVQDASTHSLSGTVRINAALGLPSLPEGMLGSALGLPVLLTGSHDLRVALDGPDRQRVALLGDLSETDVVRNGSDLWTYDSSGNAATHRTLGSSQNSNEPSAAPTTEPSPAADLTPTGEAQQLLDSMDPTTGVAVDGTTRVAGRSAYVLTLTPKTTDTLVGVVRIAVDAANHVPLQVEIVPAGATSAALTVGFTHVSFGTPSAATFQFSPPAGASVSEVPASSAQAGSGTSADTSPTTSGTGWAVVRRLPSDQISSFMDLTQDPAKSDHPRSMTDWLDRIATQVPQGHLLSTRLFSVLITPDGQLFVGAVPPSAVEAAAAGVAR
jgi:outer membrane lipoprotein-sorting protein